MRNLLAIAMLWPLAGCDIPQLPSFGMSARSAYHDVRYYDANPIERSRTNAWCGNNPGLATKLPSCDSADTSDIHAWHRKMGWE